MRWVGGRGEGDGKGGDGERLEIERGETEALRQSIEYYLGNMAPPC